MDLFNKSGVMVSALLLLVGGLIACQAQEGDMPSPTVIEAAATHIGPNPDSPALRRLQEWADQGSPVAQRELALRYLSNPARRSEAMHLLERAANAGDAQAASGLGAMYRESSALNNPHTVNELSANRLVKEVSNTAYALH